MYFVAVVGYHIYINHIYVHRYHIHLQHRPGDGPGRRRRGDRADQHHLQADRRSQGEGAAADADRAQGTAAGLARFWLIF